MNAPHPRREPTELEYEIADELLRPSAVSFTRDLKSARRHAAEVLVEYREGILELLEDLERTWHEEGRGDGTRRRASSFAVDLRDAIDAVRGLVPDRKVRRVDWGDQYADRGSGNERIDEQQAQARPQGRRWWQRWGHE